MTHRSFRELGDMLANNWGFDDSGDVDSVIKLMPNDQRLYCLMAAVVHQLRIANAELSNIRSTADFLMLQDRVASRVNKAQAPKESNPVSDGIFRWLRMEEGDLPLDSLDPSSLSIRARKSLSRGNFTMRSQLTIDNLLAVRNCGITTANEIRAWAGVISHETD